MHVNGKIPRILLAGTGSGCGKTTVTCAVLQALADRGLSVGAFKCGPDYIDPMFHARITGNRSTNLDPFFFDAAVMRYLLAKNGREREINVIEGVMGYYDGLGMTSEASTYAVAKATKSPVVLIVNAKGASLSILAQIRGFLDFREEDQIRGVLFNRCSPMLYPMLADAVREQFAGRIVPCGFLPPMPDCSLESRHLGLVTAAEVEDLNQKLAVLSAQAEKTVDLDGLLKLAQAAEEWPAQEDPAGQLSGPDLPHREKEGADGQEGASNEKKVRIAVARDKAFCFYYEDSLDVLKEMGAELVDFSPLEDQSLPEDIHGLYLGGGYPELYAKELSENRGMMDALRSAVSGGLPCIAECGGFMILTGSIGEYPMAGALPGKCFNTGKLTRFGYVTLTAGTDNMLCPAGASIRAHEFHHWDCSEPGADFTAEKANGRSWTCAVANETLYAGYPHFHFLANTGFAGGFLRAAGRYAEKSRENASSDKEKTCKQAE